MILSSRNLSKLVLSIILVVIPLIYVPTTYSPFEIPKAWFVIIVSELLVVILVARNKLDIQKCLKESKYLLLLIGWLFISSVSNNTLLTSLYGNVARFDGLFTFLHLILFSIVIGIIWEIKWGRQIAISIALGSTLISLWNLVGILCPIAVPSSATWSSNIATGFGNPNILAGYLAVTIPFVLWLIQSENKTKKMFWALSLVVILTTIFITKSWGGILGALISLYVYCIKKFDLMSLFGIVVISSVIFGLYMHNYRASVGTGYVYESRTRIFQNGMNAFLQKPIIGWGWAQFSVAFNSLNDAYVDRAHSTILEIAVAGGIIGVIMYLYILLKSIILLMRNEDKFLRMIGVMLIVYLVQSQTNVISVAEELLMWLGIGIATNLTANTNSQNQEL